MPASARCWLTSGKSSTSEVRPSLSAGSAPAALPCHSVISEALGAGETAKTRSGFSGVGILDPDDDFAGVAAFLQVTVGFGDVAEGEDLVDGGGQGATAHARV